MCPSRGWWLCLPLVVAELCPTVELQGESRIASTPYGDEDCPAFYVPSSGKESCPSGTLQIGDMEGGKLKAMDVRAVFYVPRPIGVSSGEKDLYTSAFQDLHRRDLYLMVKVLHANAVMLEPWNAKENHYDFLDLCRSLGLFVIPSFDLKYFFQESWLMRNSLEREKDMLMHFDNLLLSTRSSDPILAWTVNYALPLNETIRPTPKDSWQADDSRRQIYFSMVTALRKGHFRREWQNASKSFLRPFLLPVDLDSRRSDTDVAWYMALAETAWAPFPTDIKEPKDLESLQKWGAFDGWIGFTTPPTSHFGIADTNHQATVLTMPAGDLSEKPPEVKSEFPKCLKEESGVGCNYKSKKMKLLQFGFTALQPSEATYLKMEVNADVQQSTLREVWKNRVGQKNFHCTLGGVIIDEWADDWDRCAAQRGLPSSPFSQNVGGICDDVASDKRRHLEWYGLTAQYDLFGTHCIDARFLGGQDWKGFRFEDEVQDQELETNELLKDPNFNGFCHRLRPNMQQVVMIAVGFVVLALIWAYRLLTMWRRRPAGGHGNVEMEVLAASPENVAARMSVARRTVTANPRSSSQSLKEPSSGNLHSASSSASMASESKSVQPKAKLSMKIPQQLGGARENHRETPAVTLILQVVNNKKRNMGQEQASFHLAAHHSAQFRRLWHQVECEALSLQALGHAEAECHKKAMANVHARAMEGYLVWLQNRREPQRDRQGLEKLPCLLGKVPEPRESWELWVEVLLLRIVESLSEHGLHAPEFIAALYDSIRFAEAVNEVRIQSGTEFTIKYDTVLNGVEAIRRNGDPFRGGVNFDDVNELGLEGRIDELSKTYREASSVWVVLDLVSNFQPVFIFKLWIFLVAWYTSMSQDDRNGYLWFPTFKRANTLQYLVMGESVGSAAVDTLVILHALLQWRVASFCSSYRKAGLGFWLVRRMFSLVVSVCGALVVFTYMHIQDLDLNAKKEDIEELVNGYGPDLQKAIYACAGVLLARLLCYLLTTRGAATPFIAGRPQKNVGQARAAPAIPLNASAAVLLHSQASIRTLRDPELQEEDELPEVEPEQENRDTKRQFATAEVQILRDFAWLLMLAACFIFELKFIVPLIADFEFGAFCGDSCHIRQTKYFRFVSADCFACSSALGLCWSLVILTTFFDIYYIFYAGTAIFGYCMGEWRGLRNVLATALRHLDLDSFSSGHVPHMESGDQAMGKHRRVMSDGEAMQGVFGVSWRMVWSRIVEALYEDHVVSSEQANAMVKAASTVRWTDENGIRTVSLKGDHFSRLRFTATQLRNGVPAKDASRFGALSRCISALEVYVRKPSGGHQRRILSDVADFTIDCNLDSEDVREKMLEDLESNNSLDAMLSIPAFDLPVNSRLLAVHSVADHHSATGSISSFPKTMSMRAQAPKEEIIEDLRKVQLPALLVFQRSGMSFSEVEFTLDPPASIKFLTFKTGKDDPGLDPVCWKVEGFVADASEGGQWKQLVCRDKPYLPPSQRKADLHFVFDVEYWRTAGKAGSLTLQSFLPVVQERLSFFTASLRSLLNSKKNYSIRPGIDTLLDSHLGNIPSLTQVIPCYNETVIISAQFLRDEDGMNTNLAFIISQFPEEWRFFCERHNLSAEEMYDGFMEASETTTLSPKVCMEVRMWASMRSQTVARTVVGAMQYQEVVALLPNVQASGNPQKAAEHCVELVLAHQTYGSKAGSEENDDAVRYLLSKYRDRSFYLVFDFDFEKSRPAIVAAVRDFVRKKYSYDRPIQYASVLARFRGAAGSGSETSEVVPEECVELVEVLPRCFPLLVGTPGYLTQGKAGNQLGALRFSRGHFLQMMDANMGAFLGEACKVPFILRRFQPHWSDRTTVRARIIGFREFIFTESHGAVGSVMASAEWSFGTICQRFLSGLGARMHYGHPDFLDGFWASNRGSLSKASPAINLSEDIFAGFNVRMRGEASKHVDFLAWEKGRESSFNAAALFYTKVSKGNVGVMRSRDLKVITQNMNVVDNFSFYFASIGFYLNNLLIDLSSAVYVNLFILLALATKSLTDVASLDSMLATEWTLSMGTVAMFPRFMELTLEYGPLEGLLRFVPSIPGCMTMFTFINKSIASGLQETMVTGEASYIATGRPNANTHYSWKECYFIHCASHYYPALRIFTSYVIYELVSKAMGFSTLPMMVLLASATMWLVAPLLFCPQPTLKSLSRDLKEFWEFVIATPPWRAEDTEEIKATEDLLRTGLRDPRSSLYEFWLLRALDHKKFSCFQRVFFLIWEIFSMCFLLAVVPSSLFDYYFIMVLLYGLHYLLMEVWRLLHRPTVITLLTTLMWLVVPLITQIPMLDMLALLLITLLALKVIRSISLLIYWLALRPNVDWKQMSERSSADRAAKRAAAGKMRSYDTMVEYLYVSMMGHQLHLYAAVAILLVSLVVQFVLVILESLYGLHSWALLNPRLRNRTCCQRKRGFKPC